MNHEIVVRKEIFYNTKLQRHKVKRFFLYEEAINGKYFQPLKRLKPHKPLKHLKPHRKG